MSGDIPRNIKCTCAADGFEFDRKIFSFPWNTQNTAKKNLFHIMQVADIAMKLKTKGGSFVRNSPVVNESLDRAS